MAYRRVAACVDRGLLERLDLVRAEPTLLRATRSGLRYAGLGLEQAIVSPGSIHHWLVCASTALQLAAEAGLDQVVSDRELRLFERIEGKPLASAKVGEHPDGSPALHRPDLAIIGEKLPIAVEVELTPEGAAAPPAADPSLAPRQLGRGGPLLLRSRVRLGGRSSGRSGALAPRSGFESFRRCHGEALPLHLRALLSSPLSPRARPPRIPTLGSTASRRSRSRWLSASALGIAVAFLLRETKLRWTWTLPGAPLVPVVWLIDWRLGVGYANVVLFGSGFGYWLHKQEKERGGPEAREEDERIGPLRWAHSRISRARQSDERVVGDKLAIGTNRRGERCWVPFGRDRGVHGLVLGATGSGKTVTQAAIAVAYILAGLPVIVLDPKGDRYLRAVVRDAAARAGARFLEWSPTGNYVYNPFGRGGQPRSPTKRSPATTFLTLTTNSSPSACSAR